MQHSCDKVQNERYADCLYGCDVRQRVIASCFPIHVTGSEFLCGSVSQLPSHVQCASMMGCMLHICASHSMIIGNFCCVQTAVDCKTRICRIFLALEPPVYFVVFGSGGSSVFCGIAALMQYCSTQARKPSLKAVVMTLDICNLAGGKLAILVGS